MRGGGRAAQQLKQPPQRRHANPAARLRQRARRRRGHRQALQPGGELAHTPAYPSSGNRHAASSRYTTTREGRSRTRRCTARVCANASSTISNGTS